MITHFQVGDHKFFDTAFFKIVLVTIVKGFHKYLSKLVAYSGIPGPHHVHVAVVERKYKVHILFSHMSEAVFHRPLFLVFFLNPVRPTSRPFVRARNGPSHLLPYTSHYYISWTNPHEICSIFGVIPYTFGMKYLTSCI